MSNYVDINNAAEMHKALQEYGNFDNIHVARSMFKKLAWRAIFETSTTREEFFKRVHAFNKSETYELSLSQYFIASWKVSTYGKIFKHLLENRLSYFTVGHLSDVDGEYVYSDLVKLPFNKYKFGII